MRPLRQPRRLRSQRGVFGILYAILLPLLLAMIGLAIDLSIMYARGHELQSVADGAALAAARALDGTRDGIDNAREKAADRAEENKYRFLNSERVDWSDAALSFGRSAEGPWIGAGAVPDSELPFLTFARVDTGALDEEHGRVAVTFMRVVGASGSHSLARTAVAGRRATSLAPLGVCALNNTEISSRSNAPAANAEELLEYGFRRGVGYNLLNLNPHGLSPKSYAINPLDFPPAGEAAANRDDDTLRAFVCSGTMPAPPIASGSSVYVREPFPSALAVELNSRFADYGGGSACERFGSPPDRNVIDYRGGYASWWMNATPTPIPGSAQSLNVGGKLLTIADVNGPSAGTTNASYGPLWAFSRPLRYDSGSGGAGAPFARTDWNKLYPVSAATQPVSSYTPTVSPYDRHLSPHILLPAGFRGLPNRRVLNVPLLECPVSGTTARVLGIGRFLMTTPATVSPAAIHAEFGGLTTYGSLTASAVLYK